MKADIESIAPGQRAAIVADELLARRAATALLRAGHRVVGIAGSVGALGRTSEPPDVVVVATTTSDAAALVAAARVQAGGCLVLAILPEDGGAQLHDALAAGADAIVLDSELDATLGTALAAVLAGHVVLPRAVRPAAAQPVLSARERQIAGLVVLGLTNGEIAAKLHVAETTVKSHLTSVFRKLGVRSRGEAVARIVDPHRPAGPGILSITADPALDVFDWAPAGS